MPAIIPSNSLNYQSLFEHEFSLYLIAQRLSTATQKNYRMDIRYFFNWLISSSPKKALLNDQNKPDLNFVTPELIHDYIRSLKNTHIPLATINRRLSSLRLFFQCATLQAWCMTSPLLGIANIVQEKEKLGFEEQFDVYLASEGTSEKTRKNYRTDIQQFMEWLRDQFSQDEVSKQSLSEAILLPQVTSDAVKRYKLSLLSSHIPISTINRRLSAIRKLFQFAQKEKLSATDPTASIHNCKEDAFGNLERTLNDALFSYTKMTPLAEDDSQRIKDFFYWLESSQTYP